MIRVSAASAAGDQLILVQLPRASAHLAFDFVALVYFGTGWLSLSPSPVACRGRRRCRGTFLVQGWLSLHMDAAQRTLKLPLPAHAPAFLTAAQELVAPKHAFFSAGDKRRWTGGASE